MAACRWQRRKATRKRKSVPVCRDQGGLSPYCSQPGFTLVELLLVLGLLAMVAALAWPVVERPFSRHRLRAAADVIRAEWCLARTEASRSGSTYTFQCVVGGKQFRTRRLAEAPDTAPWAGERPEAAEPPKAALSSPGAPAVPNTIKTLPEHVVFGALSTTADSAVAPAGSELQAVGSAADGWSDSICFYPDGTTSDTRLVLVNERGNRVELTLRGLTGTVRVGEVQQPAERWQ